MTAKRRQVYEYILAGGPEGVLVEALVRDLYPDRKDTSVRTAIHYINKAIAPRRIIRRGGRITVQLKEK